MFFPMSRLFCCDMGIFSVIKSFYILLTIC